MNDLIQVNTLNASTELSVEAMKTHVDTIAAMTKAVMKTGLHYGTIPRCGTKPTLLLPGAQKLAIAFQLTV